MKDQIAMSKANGELCIVIPLYRQYTEDLSNLEGYAVEGYSVSLTNNEPLAYVIDGGPNYGQPQLCSAKIAEKYLEFLGDL